LLPISWDDGRGLALPTSAREACKETLPPYEYHIYLLTPFTGTLDRSIVHEIISFSRKQKKTPSSFIKKKRQARGVVRCGVVGGR
jgi:hypothetical protein